MALAKNAVPEGTHNPAVRQAGGKTGGKVDRQPPSSAILPLDRSWWGRASSGLFRQGRQSVFRVRSLRLE